MKNSEDSRDNRLLERGSFVRGRGHQFFSAAVPTPIIRSGEAMTPQGRIEYLLEFFFTNKLGTYNIGNIPTFVASTRQDAMGITLRDTLMNGLLWNW